ncbi:hypothetical protein NHG97_22760 [Pseudomonas corrugata]|nr:hypothetical protein [Pseudomonas corrugata]MDU9041516.1 hypothetical protein [Pseudomonas corrugata]
MLAKAVCQLIVMVGGKWVVRNGHHAAEEQSARAFTQVLRDLLG